MSNQKPHQFDIQQRKRQESWARDMEAANTEYQLAVSKNNIISENRKDCIKLAIMASEKVDSGKTPQEWYTEFEAFINEPLHSVKFNMPTKPVVDSNIKLLD